MRLTLWLSILVMISGLFWPELANEPVLIFCALLFFLLLFISRFSFIAVIPFFIIYFTLYTNLTLSGHLPTFFPFANKHALQHVVDGQNHSIIVQVNSLISDKNHGYFRAKLIELDGNHLNYSPLLEMRWYKPILPVQEGQLHRFSVSFKPVYGRANPAGFDRQKWLYSEHVAYQANIKKHLEIISNNDSVRARIYKKVSEITDGLDHQGVILALSFADKSMIDFSKKELIQALGISHLFAISGLHIGLVFSAVYLLIYFLVARYFPLTALGWFSWYVVNVVALTVAFFYAYLAGFSLPTQRAFLMLLSAVVILSMKRKCGLVDLLTFILFIILLWDPLAVLGLSLWLSFLAVSIILLLLWAFPHITNREGGGQKKSLLSIKYYFKILLLIQIAITLLMMPIQLMAFSALSLLAPIVNLFAVPFFSLLVIPLILLATVLTFVFEPIALFLFYLSDQLITLFFTLFAGGGFAYQVFSEMNAKLLLFLVSLFILLFIIHFQVSNNRKVSYLFALVLSVFVLNAVYQQQKERQKEWFVEVIDVGQGLAVLVRSQGKSLLYDTGPSYPSGFTTAKSEIVPYLQSQGITQLDYLVISHSDIDHAGGVSVISDYFAPKTLFVGEPLKENRANYSLISAGDKWVLGDLSVTVLSPFSTLKNNNNNSAVLRLSDGQFSLLLTGDIEKKQEQLIVKKHADTLQSTILLAPHHGSKHSSSENFIKKVNPQWVVFSAGFMNHWGFPALDVKLRYQNQGVKMVNSGQTGFVRFKITKQGINMQTFREDLSAYWYHHSLSQ